MDGCYWDLKGIYYTLLQILMIVVIGSSQRGKEVHCKN